MEHSENTPDVLRLVEAVLFLENRPVHLKQIARIVGCEGGDVKEALRELERSYREQGSSLLVMQNEGGDYYLTVRPELYRKLGNHYDSRKKIKLSTQALETLAIVAYKQPITRAEIEKIRGVRVGHVLRSLLELELIRINGRKDVPGKPVLYGTTEKFLKFFGLLSIKDLPVLSELNGG